MSVVLVADDHAEDLATYSAALEQAGHTVIQCSDVHDAMRLAQRCLPEVVVASASLAMPDAGLLLPELLASVPLTSGIRTIVIAPSADPAIRHRVLNCRTSEFHVTPLASEHLVAAVNRVLEAPNAANRF
jgi:DNA-binding NtrC family response regulator